MADPLSILGGISAILQISSAVVELIRTAKDSSNDRQKLLAEIRTTSTMCEILRDSARIDAQPWLETIRILSEKDGPLDQYKECLLFINKKLVSARSGPLKVFKWTLAKEDVQEALAIIKRQESLLNIALAHDNMRLSMVIQGQLERVADGVEAIVVDNENERRWSILSRLTTIDFEATHADILSRRARDTGTWLLKTPQYVSWKEQDSNSILWCQGMPGSGKTILSSVVIDSIHDMSRSSSMDSIEQAPKHLAKVDPSRRIGIAGLYCSYRNPQSAMNMIGSLLQQLIKPLDMTPRSIPMSLNVAYLLAMFSNVLPSYAKIVLVIDAFDECASRVDLLKGLRKLLQATPNAASNTSLHILITSRIDVTADIEADMEPNFRLEVRCDNDDVRLFLMQSLREQGRLSKLISRSSDLEALIINAILPRLSGMFLLARLYMDLLATLRGVRDALEKLPNGIEETYSEAWDRICDQSPQNADLGRKVLLWIIHTTRPLRLQELQYALAVEEGDDELDPGGILEATDLTSFCAGLVVLDEQSDWVSLVHATTQEYFKNRRETLFPAAHETIATTCVTYLRMKPFSIEGALQKIEPFLERRRHCPLLVYAAVNWGWHVQKANSERGTKLALSLLQDTRARSAASQVLFIYRFLTWILNIRRRRDWKKRYSKDLESSWKNVGAKHLAAYFGLIDALRMLLEENRDIEEIDEMAATSLHWALMNDDNHMLKYLLEKGANPNAIRNVIDRKGYERTSDCTTPLGIAAARDNTEAILSLVSHGAEIDGQQGSPGTALYEALRTGSYAAANVLLDTGADPNAKFVMGYVMCGDLDILRRLIEAGISKFNIQEALVHAARANQIDQIRLLLAHGADINGDRAITNMSMRRTKSDSGTSVINKSERDSESDDRALEVKRAVRVPLVECIAGSRVREGNSFFDCFLLLLNEGAEVNCISDRNYLYADDFFILRSGNGCIQPPRRTTTPLLTAAYYGSLNKIRTLVERGADINFSAGKHTALTTALHGESYYVRENESSSLRVRRTLELLIEFGANLHLCLPKDQNRIRKLLSISIEDCETTAALQKVVVQPQLGHGNSWHNKTRYRDRRDALKELLAKGADPRLCSLRDRRRIDEFLSWSEEKLDELDEDREAMLERYL